MDTVDTQPFHQRPTVPVTLCQCDMGLIRTEIQDLCSF